MNTFAGTTCSFKLYGNIMSIIYNDNFTGQTTFPNGSTRNFDKLFEDCTGLTDASNLILPATTLTNYCYDFMFNGCSNLVSAPELPATTLINYCYNGMFNGCRKLNYIKCLATNISASSCTNNWVSGVQTVSGTFITPSSTSWTRGVKGIPNNWTRVDA